MEASAIVVLLVEDNELNRDMLDRRLRRRGFKVILARDGLEALERARTRSPTVILMDMSLPKLDGWEAMPRLKADEATAAIPIVALTAHAMQVDRERAFAAGCDAFETKPIDFESLVATVLRLAAGEPRGGG